MSTRARVLALLKEFFTKREMEVEEGGSLDLSVKDGNNLVGVKVSLGPLVRRDVEELMVKAPELEYDKLYIAVPAKYVSMLPPLDIIREAGIGVLEVSSDTVRVLVFPRSRRAGHRGGVPREEIAELRAEVERLKDEVRRLKGVVARVESLERRLAALERQKRRGMAAPVPKAKVTVEGVTEKSPEGVPSFAADNPWLTILSKRGEK